MKFTLALRIKGYDKPLPGSELGPGVIATQEVEYSDDVDQWQVAVDLAGQITQFRDEFIKVDIA